MFLELFLENILNMILNDISYYRSCLDKCDHKLFLSFPFLVHQLSAEMHCNFATKTQTPPGIIDIVSIYQLAS